MASQVKPKVTRDWSFIATVLALLGIVTGYALANVSFEASPTAENYVVQRALHGYAQGALGLISGGATLVSLALGVARRAVIGTVAGALATAFVFVWLPSQLRACCGGDESSVIGLLRSVNSAQQAYSSSCANGKFASTLAALTTPPVPGGSAFLAPGMDRGFWRGYSVTMQTPDAAATDVVACNGTRVGSSSYFVEAHLIDAIPGRRNFATDERGTIYSNRDGTAIQPGMAGADPVQ